MPPCYSEKPQNTTYMTFPLTFPGHAVPKFFDCHLFMLADNSTFSLIKVEKKTKQSCPGLFLLKSYNITLTLIQIPLQTEQFLSASLKIRAERKRKGSGNK